MRRLKLLVLALPVFALGACAPNAPCLRGHNETWTSMQQQCVGYGKYGCNNYIYVPQYNTDWVCDAYGTPYPSGDPRR